MENERDNDKKDSLLVYPEEKGSLWHSGYIPQDAREQSHQCLKYKPTKASGEDQQVHLK